MKKVTAILLFAIYCLTATELGQLLKLPKLMEHFAEHAHEDAGVTFTDFLAMHYSPDAPKDEDYEEDKQLPFKEHNTSAGTNWIVFTPVTSSVIFTPTNANAAEHFILYSEDFISSSLSVLVWQPPKSC